MCGMCVVCVMCEVRGCGSGWVSSECVGGCMCVGGVHRGLVKLESVSVCRCLQVAGKLYMCMCVCVWVVGVWVCWCGLYKTCRCVYKPCVHLEQCVHRACNGMLSCYIAHALRYSAITGILKASKEYFKVLKLMLHNRLLLTLYHKVLLMLTKIYL